MSCRIFSAGTFISPLAPPRRHSGGRPRRRRYEELSQSQRRVVLPTAQSEPRPIRRPRLAGGPSSRKAPQSRVLSDGQERRRERSVGLLGRSSSGLRMEIPRTSGSERLFKSGAAPEPSGPVVRNWRKWLWNGRRHPATCAAISPTGPRPIPPRHEIRVRSIREGTRPHQQSAAGSHSQEAERGTGAP